MRKVEVHPYKKDWMNQFENEKNELERIFQSELVEVHHIGSTSVQGLKAKPVIDILPVVKDIHRVKQFNDQMIALGYEPRGEYGIPGRRFFRKGGDNRTHHVHIFAHGDPHIERHLAFRDYLRVHPEQRDEYGNLKEALSIQYPYQIDAYMDGKEKLVTEIENQALKWYRTGSVE